MHNPHLGHIPNPSRSLGRRSLLFAAGGCLVSGVALSQGCGGSNRSVSPNPAPPGIPVLLGRYTNAMRAVPGGTFAMQAIDGPAGAGGLRQTTLSAFRIGATPVTVGMWKEYCRATNTALPEAPPWGWSDNHPMVRVTWNDAVDFCAWASRTTGKSLQLPTEAQWEYAARDAGKTLAYPWGETFDGRRLWWFTQSRVAGTGAVDRTQYRHTNPLGISDLSGNAAEWCADHWAEAYPNTPDVDPAGPPVGEFRVVRGGAWFHELPERFRITARLPVNPRYRGAGNDSIGFRLVERRAP